MSSFQVTYYYRLPRGTVPFPFMCCNLHASHLTLRRVTHFLLPKVIVLSFEHIHGKGITLPPTVGTPTPNGVSSNWDFVSRRFPECWWVQHHQQEIGKGNGKGLERHETCISILFMKIMEIRREGRWKVTRCMCGGKWRKIMENWRK